MAFNSIISTMALSNSVLETALRIATGGLTGVIFDTTVELIRKGSEGTLDEPIAQLREDTERQKLAMEMGQAQARVAQELAIARRIETAEEVQIEEYYEYTGDGSLGLKADEKGLTLGAAGSGQRVSKRIYRFTGQMPDTVPPSSHEADANVKPRRLAKNTSRKKVPSNI